MKKTGIIMVAVLFLMVLGGFFMLFNYEKFFSGEDNLVKTRLIIDEKEFDTKEKVLYEDSEIYVPYDIVTKYLTEDVRLTKNKNKILIKTKNLNFDLETPDITRMVKDADIEISVFTKLIKGKVYIPLSSLKYLLGIEVKYDEVNKVLVIDRFGQEFRKGYVTVDQAFLFERKEGDTKIRKLIRNEELRVISEDDKWFRIRTDNGDFGYTYKNIVEEYDYKSIPVSFIREPIDKTKKINVTWEFVYDRTPDISEHAKIDGLDVLSPTWYSVRSKGDIFNKGDFKYVRDAHEKGYKVWGLVDNGFDPKLTSEFLRDDKYREMIIAQIVLYASLHNLDGVNIDFENVYYEDKDVLVSFVKELTDYLRMQGVVVSMDVTVPGGSKQWSLVYDREKLGSIVDYICLMAYDEHWAASPKSGSVASIGWVEEGIVNSLKTIPEDKLLLGIPFYSRLWKEVEKDGKIKVTSNSIPIRNTEELLGKYEATFSWDSETGQNYSEFEKDGFTYKMWIEDKDSIKLKLNLIDKYNLGGSALWRKGYEYEEVWEIIKSD